MNDAELDDFETALLHELRGHVAERVSYPRRASRLRIAVATAITTAAAAAGVIGFGTWGPGSSAAYAVEPQPNGSIRVTVLDMSHTKGLERALKEQGVDANVLYRPDVTKPSDLADGGTSAGCPPVGDVRIEAAEGGGVTFMLEAEFVAAHNSLVLRFAGGRYGETWLAVSALWTGADC